MKEELLPISLVSLTITNLYKRKSLERNILQHLSNLEKLEFKYCQRLDSLPEDTFPSSLKVLWIKECRVRRKICKTGALVQNFSHPCENNKWPSHNMSSAKRKKNAPLFQVHSFLSLSKNTFVNQVYMRTQFWRSIIQSSSTMIYMVY